MKKLLKEILYWCQLLLLPVYCLSHLFPRSKQLWVFGSTFGRRFADNPKYLYLYTAGDKGCGVKAVWISKNKEIIKVLKGSGLCAYYLYSPSGIWHCLRAKVYIYDNYSKDICYTLSGGAVKVNLWHGLPLKKIQKDNIHDRVRNPGSFPERLHGIPRRLSDEKPGDYVLSASELFRPIFSSAFNTGNVLVSAYPRVDMLTCNAEAFYLTGREKELIDSLKSSSGRIVLYMPTFRDSERKLLDVIDFQDFSDFLKKENIILCIKLHHKSRLRNELTGYNDDNIIIADPDADPYPLCSLADILVTDYSSIYFDYLITDRPIIFFPYDYEEYLSASRELYFNYNDFTPGIKVRNMKDLELALTGPDEYNNERKALREKLYNGMDMQCCSKQLLNLIKKNIL